MLIARCGARAPFARGGFHGAAAARRRQAGPAARPSPRAADPGSSRSNRRSRRACVRNRSRSRSSNRSNRPGCRVIRWPLMAYQLPAFPDGTAHPALQARMATPDVALVRLMIFTTAWFCRRLTRWRGPRFLESARPFESSFWESDTMAEAVSTGKSPFDDTGRCLPDSKGPTRAPRPRCANSMPRAASPAARSAGWRTSPSGSPPGRARCRRWCGGRWWRSLPAATAWRAAMSRPGRLRRPATRSSPGGGRDRADQPVLRCCRPRAEGLRPGARPADRAISRGAALDERGCAATMAFGMEAVAGDVDLLCVGDLGVGNSTVAAALFAALLGGAGADWIGSGSGADDADDGAQGRGGRRRARLNQPAISTIRSRCCAASAAANSRRSPARSWRRASSASR